MPTKHCSSDITLPSLVEGHGVESPHLRWAREFFEQNLQRTKRHHYATFQPHNIQRPLGLTSVCRGPLMVYKGCA